MRPARGSGNARGKNCIANLPSTAMSLTSTELENLLGFTKELAKRAGAIILEGSRAIKSSQAVNLKKNAGTVTASGHVSASLAPTLTRNKMGIPGSLTNIAQSILLPSGMCVWSNLSNRRSRRRIPTSSCERSLAQASSAGHIIHATVHCLLRKYRGRKLCCWRTAIFERSADILR